MSYLNDRAQQEIRESSRDRILTTLELLDQPDFVEHQSRVYEGVLMFAPGNVDPRTGRNATELAEEYQREWHSALTAELDRRDLEALAEGKIDL